MTATDDAIVLELSDADLIPAIAAWTARALADLAKDESDTASDGIAL